MKNVIAMVCAFAVSTGLAETTYHVSNTGSHTYPFSNMAEAATNIQAAVNLAADDDTVLVDDGEYLLSSAVLVSNSISIKSVSGPSETMVIGNGTDRCFTLEDVACMIAGLTITNGIVINDNGGGIYCEGTSPVVTNCIITSCIAENGGGIAGCTLYDSLVEDNEAVEWGGGLYEAIVCNSKIFSNEAGGYSGGLETGIASNCLFKGNTCGIDGGGASFSKIYNCTVVDNSADGQGGGLDTCDSYNSIVYTNSSISGEADISNPSDLMFCCSPDALDGFEGNVSGDPGFVDFAGGNYRLQSGSPCIDTGTNAYVASATDLDGNARISGGIVDMGAYEVQVAVSDLDGDGMEDSWEIYYFDSTNAQPYAHGDFDEQFNIEEYIAGTDPTDSDSFFAITNWSTGSFIVEWAPSVTGREYRVQWAESLTNSYSQQGPMIDHPQNSYTDTAHSAESSGFYKVEVQLK